MIINEDIWGHGTGNELYLDVKYHHLFFGGGPKLNTTSGFDRFPYSVLDSALVGTLVLACDVGHYQNLAIVGQVKPETDMVEFCTSVSRGYY